MIETNPQHLNKLYHSSWRETLKTTTFIIRGDNMKKMAMFLIMMICCSCFQVSAKDDVFEAKKVDFDILIHGRQEKFDLPITVINDNTYVPLRELCVKLKMDLDWDGYDKVIYISKKAPLAPTPEPQTTQNPYKTNVELTAYSIKDFSFLTIDMSMHDIMERMGNPSYWEGSGAPWAVYVLADGSELSLAMYRYDIEERKNLKNPGVILNVNGTNIKITFDSEGMINIY